MTQKLKKQFANFTAEIELTDRIAVKAITDLGANGVLEADQSLKKFWYATADNSFQLRNAFSLDKMNAVIDLLNTLDTSCGLYLDHQRETEEALSKASSILFDNGFEEV